jgi:peptidoglycan LD-endopeptidase CwlK
VYGAADLVPRFSAVSDARLATCDPRLVALFEDVVQRFDCTVLEGARTVEQQTENVRKGVSKTMDSRHLDRPSRAVDVAPYPVRWPVIPVPGSRNTEYVAWAKDLARFYLFAGYVLARAKSLGIAVRWGGDWDGDHDLRDQTFDDLPHWELR